jgi:hypothetical protein
MAVECEVEGDVRGRFCDYFVEGECVHRGKRGSLFTLASGQIATLAVLPSLLKVYGEP